MSLARSYSRVLTKVDSIMVTSDILFPRDECIYAPLHVVLLCGGSFRDVLARVNGPTALELGVCQGRFHFGQFLDGILDGLEILLHRRHERPTQCQLLQVLQDILHEALHPMCLDAAQCFVVRDANLLPVLCILVLFVLRFDRIEDPLQFLGLVAAGADNRNGCFGILVGKLLAVDEPILNVSQNFLHEKEIIPDFVESFRQTSDRLDGCIRSLHAPNDSDHGSYDAEGIHVCTGKPGRQAMSVY